MSEKLNKNQIKDLLPHREPMLLIDELIEIKKLSTFIAIYFLSTIVADHIASAIFLSSTNASPLYFQTLPWDLIA